MSRIGDLLHGEDIIEELTAGDKEEVLAEFARLLSASGKVAQDAELIRALREREALGSTGIGDGIAIPHAKLPFLRGPVVAFGRSGHGIDFQSLDGKPAHLFFVLVTPDDSPGEHLRTLARISRILKNRALREQLMQAAGRERIRQLIAEEDGKYPQR